MQNIAIQPENIKMETSPESNADETVVISAHAESLNNTFVLKQLEDAESTKRLATTTPYRSKPPVDSRCLTKSITKPAIQRKRLLINNHKSGSSNKKVNQENMPLIIAATRTLADPSLTKAVTKARTISSNTVLTTKSSEFQFL